MHIIYNNIMNNIVNINYADALDARPRSAKWCAASYRGCVVPLSSTAVRLSAS